MNVMDEWLKYCAAQQICSAEFAVLQRRSDLLFPLKRRFGHL